MPLSLELIPAADGGSEVGLLVGLRKIQTRRPAVTPRSLIFRREDLPQPRVP